MRNTRRQDTAGPSPDIPRRPELGTACLAGLIVATLGGGVAVLSASPLATIFSVLGILAVLAFVMIVMV